MRPRPAALLMLYHARCDHLYLSLLLSMDSSLASNTSCEGPALSTTVSCACLRRGSGVCRAERIAGRARQREHRRTGFIRSYCMKRVTAVPLLGSICLRVRSGSRQWRAPPRASITWSRRSHLERRHGAAWSPCLCALTLRASLKCCAARKWWRPRLILLGAASGSGLTRRAAPRRALCH